MQLFVFLRFDAPLFHERFPYSVLRANRLNAVQILAPDTNILLNFSYPVKRVVVSEIVNHLLDPETSPKILTTPTHVKWVLEVIGQGFSLPIEDVPIMEKCVALYSQWLLSPPELRPPGFKEQDQYFFQARKSQHRLWLTVSFRITLRATESFAHKFLILFL